MKQPIDQGGPDISVVMPVFNAAAYLREAIESILSQTYAHFELLAYDDGSTDGSQRILEEYARRDGRVVVRCGEHRGQVAWRNAAVQESRCRYLACMDADDISMSDRLEKQRNFMEAQPACAVVGTRVLMVDSLGYEIAVSDPPLSHDSIDAAHLAPKALGAQVTNQFMRTEAVRAVGGYNESLRYAEDLDLFLRLTEAGHKLANIPDVLLKYRMHDQGIGFRNRDSQTACVVQAVLESYRRRGIEPPADYVAQVPKGDANKQRNWIIRTALRNGHWRTARRHALLDLARRPWSPWAWKVAGRTAFGWWADKVYP